MNIESSSNSQFDFANILFSWNCNAKCPYCIGHRLENDYPGNLDSFPLENFDVFLHLVQKYKIPEIIFTGTTTDPLLYRHQEKLLDIFKQETPRVRRAIHTNGFLILKKLDVFNRYTKCTLSLPSFREDIFHIMMGTKQAVPDIKEISLQSGIPIKVSRIVSETNNSQAETSHFIETLSDTKISRVAFRKLAGDMSPWDDTIEQLEKLWAIYVWEYRDNSIYTLWDIEITLWSFDATSSRSLNLFSSGHISHEYLLSKSEK